MKTFFQGNRALFLAVAALLVAITFGMTSCNGSASSPIASIDALTSSSDAFGADVLGANALSTGFTAQTDLLNEMRTAEVNAMLGVGEMTAETLNGGNPRTGTPPTGGTPPVGSTRGTISTTRGTIGGTRGTINAPPEIRTEAVFEIVRRPMPQDRATAGATSTAKFSGALGVQGVSLSVLGNTYQFFALPRRTPERPASTNANARPQPLPESIFVYPVPPSSTATTSPTPIPLTDANALATFRVNAYVLQDNSIDIPGKISVTSIQENASLPRTAPLTINWTLPGTFTGGIVTLQNVLDSAALRGLSRSEIARVLNNNKPISKRITAGATSVTFTAAELASLQAGNVHLTIAVANTKRTNDGRAVMTAHSANSVFFRFQ